MVSWLNCISWHLAERRTCPLMLGINGTHSLPLHLCMPFLGYLKVEMLGSSSQHLKIQSPSSTTVSYTVSNALPQSTRSSKFLFVLGIIFRILLCIFVLAVDVAKLQPIPYFQHLLLGPFNLQDVPTGLWASNVAALVDWRLIATGSVSILYFCSRKGYTGVNANLQPSPQPEVNSSQWRRYWSFKVLEFKHLPLLQHTYLPQPRGLSLQVRFRTLSFMKLSRDLR